MINGGLQLEDKDDVMIHITSHYNYCQLPDDEHICDGNTTPYKELGRIHLYKKQN